MGPLADAMRQVADTARECLNCGNIGTTDICEICQSEKRGNGELCVVEDVADLWAMERAGFFKGRYPVLGGTLSALAAIGPEDLAGHTNEFREAWASKAGHEGLLVAAKALAMTAIDLLAEPANLDEAKKAFAQQKSRTAS